METRVDRETGARRPSGLAMPQQAPPVDRTAVVACAAYGDTPGVEASSFWSTLADVAKTVGPVALGML
ncbi:hypothetical protein AQI95_40565 [Streptomyces yokosukanensis]|uniref:Uncharacterized protein n=1 Tax=Streptomyces yokosukanensis TaxID=67386 RepID=A0A101NTG1_9ACTN|nr:hypothetical protein [Streptomyces yokosukanensis]KUM99084.1 hypothetical protein AQI95_40565 [Streptomyces yokosukanensis]